MNDDVSIRYSDLLKKVIIETRRLDFKGEAGSAFSYECESPDGDGWGCFQVALGKPETSVKVRRAQVDLELVRVAGEEPPTIRQEPHSQLVILSWPPIYCPAKSKAIVIASVYPGHIAPKFDVILCFGKVRHT